MKKPMSHEERIALINKPFPTVQIHGGRAWGGCVVSTLGQDIRVLHTGKDDDPSLSAYEPYDSNWSRE